MRSKICCTGWECDRDALHLLAAILAGLLLVACAPVRFPPYEAGAAKNYPTQQTRGDLRVAVAPMIDADEQRKYFGLVLTDIGVLPVLIVVENQSASARYLLRDEQIMLQSTSTQQYFPKLVQNKVTDTSGSETAHDAALGVGTATVLVGPMILALPAAFTAVKFAKDSESAALIQDNLFDKTLFTRTVLPGATISGFAYFKVADGKLDPAQGGAAIPEGATLHAQLSNQDGGVAQSFTFAIRQQAIK